MTIRINASGSKPTTTAEIVTGSNRTYLGSSKRVLDVAVADSISHVEYQVHDSNLWSVSQIFDDVNTSAASDLLLITSSTTGLHLAFQGVAGGDAKIFLCEGASVSANGTTVTAFNHNRADSTATSAQWFHTPTVLTTGSILFSDFVPGGSGNFGNGGDSGGPVREGAEWVLAADTKYLFRISNQAAGAETMSIKMGYYEE